jgi:hypothetical protein
MKLEDACSALKLECGLRQLGFVLLEWKVIANCGLYMIFPVGFYLTDGPDDDLLGYQLERSCTEQLLDHRGLHLGSPIAHTAGAAFDLANRLS